MATDSWPSSLCNQVVNVSSAKDLVGGRDDPIVSRMVKTVARYSFIAVWWVLLIALGACCAILVPLNLILIPGWLAMATSVGPLARKLFGDVSGSHDASLVLTHDKLHSLPTRASASSCSHHDIDIAA